MARLVTGNIKTIQPKGMDLWNNKIFNGTTTDTDWDSNFPPTKVVEIPLNPKGTLDVTACTATTSDTSKIGIDDCVVTTAGIAYVTVHRVPASFTGTARIRVAVKAKDNYNIGPSEVKADEYRLLRTGPISSGKVTGFVPGPNINNTIAVCGTGGLYDNNKLAKVKLYNPYGVDLEVTRMQSSIYDTGNNEWEFSEFSTLEAGKVAVLEFDSDQEGYGDELDGFQLDIDFAPSSQDYPDATIQVKHFYIDERG